MLAGFAWAASTFLLIRRWSSATGWQDAHRYAMVFGATLVPMIGGFAGSSAWSRIDLIGKVIFDAIAILLLIALGRTVRRRAARL